MSWLHARRGRPNSEIDAILENAYNPTSLEIVEAIDDPQGEFTAPLGTAGNYSFQFVKNFNS